MTHTYHRTGIMHKPIPIGRGKLIVFALMLVLCAGCLSPAGTASPAYAAASQDKSVTVKAGFFNNGDFMHKDENGDYAGYDVEYYYTLAGYAGWNIDFVEYNSLDEALAGLAKGDISILSGLSKTPERESKFISSSQKMATAHIAVQTRADDDRYSAGDTSTMKDMTCGILKGSNVVALYESWCRENGIRPHIVEYDDLESRNQALMKRKVDAIAGGSTIEGAQKIAEFPSLDLYFMLNKKKAGLKSQLDRAMNILSLQEPTFSNELFSKYFPASRNRKPSFSAAEKKYLAKRGSIRVALLANDAPFSRRGSGGSAEGILPEYYTHLAKMADTGVKFVLFSSKEEACRALMNGKVDAVGKSEDDVYSANSSGMILSRPYLQTNMVQITHAGKSRLHSAAVPQCNAAFVKKTAKGSGSSWKIRVYANSEASFQAMKSGKTDAVICTQPAAQWLLNRNRASEYVVSSFGSSQWEVACAFARGDEGNILRSILNKCLMVDGGRIGQLITSDTLRDSADITSVFNLMPASYIIVFAAIAGLLLVITVIALIIIIRRRRMERKLAEQQAALVAAEEANRARHDFFGTVSHDMRTPLNGITGFTELALQSDDMAEVRGHLQKIRMSSQMLTELVDDVLVMSRMQNGKYSISAGPGDLRETIEEVLPSVRALAEQKKITFTDDLGEAERQTVIIDRLSIQKIVLNLLSNAVRFTPAGGTVRLYVKMHPGEDDLLDCTIRITDTGIGISDDFLPHVFEPFAQESPARENSSGTGMGLSIVKSIVDALGGTVEAESEKGAGTSFTVRLHLQKAAAGSDAAAKAQAGEADFRDYAGGNGGNDADGADIGSGLRGRHALVCEDNRLNLEIIKSILERSGIEVTAVENGLLGVEAFAGSKPGYYDIVLLDLRMPVMDGNEAARRIRGLERPDAAEIPIYAVSADAFVENVDECLANGMNGHIAKPIDPQLLISTISKALKKEDDQEN